MHTLCHRAQAVAAWTVCSWRRNASQNNLKQPGHIHGPELAFPQGLRREVLQVGSCHSWGDPGRAASLRGSAAACGTQLIWILLTSAIAGSRAYFGVGGGCPDLFCEMRDRIRTRGLYQVCALVLKRSLQLPCVSLPPPWQEKDVGGCPAHARAPNQAGQYKSYHTLLLCRRAFPKVSGAVTPVTLTAGAGLPRPPRKRCAWLKHVRARA